jgi:hypothetical protein
MFYVSPSGASRASSHDKRGMSGPERQTHSVNPQTFSTPSQAQSRSRCGASANKRYSRKSPERPADRLGKVNALHKAS